MRGNGLIFIKERSLPDIFTAGFFDLSHEPVNCSLNGLFDKYAAVRHTAIERSNNVLVFTMSACMKIKSRAHLPAPTDFSSRTYNAIFNPFALIVGQYWFKQVIAFHPVRLRKPIIALFFRSALHAVRLALARKQRDGPNECVHAVR